MRQVGRASYWMSSRQSKPTLFVFVFSICVCGFLISLHSTGNNQDSIKFRDVNESQDIEKISRIPHVKEQSTSPLTSAPEPPNTEDCNCKSEESGKTYSFCYVDPQNSSSIGKRFDCGSVKTLETLKVLNYPTPLPTMSEYIKDKEQVVFVSSTSDDHYTDSHASYLSIRKHYPHHKYILFGLKLSNETIARLPNDNNFEFRQFDTSRYPDYVNKWLQYRFKPLIMAEILMEYPNVWWIDAHIKMRKPNVIENFFNDVSENRSTDDYSTITSFVTAGHSNFAVLFPELLEYFPTNSIPLLKTSTQYAAGIIHIPRTEKTMEIFKWCVLCALDEKCLNPPGSQIYCQFGPNRMETFAKCFRYDQSVLNLLLLNRYQDPSKYFDVVNDTFTPP